MLNVFVVHAQSTPNKLDAAGKKQGHWIKFDANKKKVYDGNFVNDIPVGKVSYYYDSGVLRAEMNFSKNGTIAYAKLFHPGGKLMGEGKYVSEKKDSVWKYYDEEAVLLSQETSSRCKRWCIHCLLQKWTSFGNKNMEKRCFGWVH